MRSYTSGVIYGQPDKTLRNRVPAGVGNTFVWTEEGVSYTTTFSEHLRGVRKIGMFVKEVTIIDGIHYIPDFWITKGWVVEAPIMQVEPDVNNAFIDYIYNCNHFLVCSSHNKYIWYTSRGNFSMTYSKSKAHVFKSFSDLESHLTPKCRLLTSKYTIYLYKPSLIQHEYVNYRGFNLFIAKV